MTSPLTLKDIDAFVSRAFYDWDPFTFYWSYPKEDIVLLAINGLAQLVASAGTKGFVHLTRRPPVVRYCDFKSAGMQRRGQPGSWFPLRELAFTPTIARELDKDFTPADDGQKGCMEDD